MGHIATYFFQLNRQCIYNTITINIYNFLTCGLVLIGKRNFIGGVIGYEDSKSFLYHSGVFATG
jgi:hypothetical protein